MCFTRRKSKAKKAKKEKKEKKYKRKIYPERTLEEVNKITTEEFSRECITCFQCKEIFNLESNEIKIHCMGCNQFFHCGIAGKCSGKNCCSITMRGQYHRLSWCVNCVPKMKGNEAKPGGIGYCTCNDCLE